MALARPQDRYPDQSWWGWGDPDLVPELSDQVHGLLRDALGVRSPGTPAHRLDELALPDPRLDAAVKDQLAGVVGPDHVRDDHESRLRHTRGKSTPDLLRLRAGDTAGAPDAVVLPASHDEIIDLLRICSAERVAVTPFGGGTSVVGGLTPRTEQFTGSVVLDLRRLNAVLEIDDESRLAVIEPGLRGPEAELLLAERGFTIGHHPQSFEYATLGGFAAARSSGQASAGYGRFDELVLGMRVATPLGSLSLGRAPKSAAGPDLRQLLLGSEGTLGVITSLTVQLRPLPETRVYDGWRFESFKDGAATIRRLVQDGPVPTVLRLSDEAETAVNLAQPAEIGSAQSPGCLAIVGYEGASEEVRERRSVVTEILTGAGAVKDAGAGEHWARDRYRGPYLRDALLDAGALVETLETVCFWSSIAPLYEAVSSSLRESLTAQGTPPVVLCHISHVYPAGASLYFTVACAALEDPIKQWLAAKAAASHAIIAGGASITHHHGVGIDHRDWYAQEIGPLGIELLRAAKSALDPNGILNPGVLVPNA